MSGIQLWVLNTGGKWLLTDENWKALESAGWDVQWCHRFEKCKNQLDQDLKFKGTPAIGAFLANTKSVQKAKTMFELITGLDANIQNCQCCENPFQFERKENIMSYYDKPVVGISYSSNNSGGSWWLSDQDWRNLEEAGWTVDWAKDSTSSLKREMREDNRWLGALATSAKLMGETSIRVAIAKWEDVVGQDADNEGCNCCGQPHSFYEIREGDYDA